MTASPAAPDDVQIVRKVLDGDRQEFKRLIERHQARVFNLLVRLVKDRETAMDLGQEAFLKAYMYLDRYDVKRSFSNWILKIAQNVAFTHLKRAGVSKERLVLDGPEDRGADRLADPNPMSDPEEQVSRKAMAGLAHQVMERLPEKYRVVLTLRYMEGLEYQDIAEVLEIPLGTVKFRLYQAHRLLEDAFTRYGVIQK